MYYLDKAQFKEINWLPIEKRVEQCIGALVFKSFWKKVPKYIEDIIIPKVIKYSLREPDMLTQPCCNTSNGQKAICYQASEIWSDIPSLIKKKESLIAFKHEYKKHFFKAEVI